MTAWLFIFTAMVYANWFSGLTIGVDGATKREVEVFRQQVLLAFKNLFENGTAVEPILEKNYAGNNERVLRILQLSYLSLAESTNELMNSIKFGSTERTISWNNVLVPEAVARGHILVPKNQIARDVNDFKRYPFTISLNFNLNATCARKHFAAMRKACETVVSNMRLTQNQRSPLNESGAQQIAAAKLEWLLYDMVREVVIRKLEKTMKKSLTGDS